jgi:hypothetical protein
MALPLLFFLDLPPASRLSAAIWRNQRPNARGPMTAATTEATESII